MTQDKLNSDYQLVRNESGVLELVKTNITSKKVEQKIFVDFLSGEFQQRLKTLSKTQPLIKALSLEKGDLVLDATAGLGKDALSICHFGVNVIAIEENPIVFALLEDGLRRALEHEKFNKKFSDKIKLVQGSSLEYMKSIKKKPHTIYLDPMYPTIEKTAKPKKEMAFLRDILEETKNIEELLDQALITATKRVVLKRPIGSPELKKPSHSFESKMVRFDMYLMNHRIMC